MTIYIFLGLGLLVGIGIGYALGRTETKAKISEIERPWKAACEAQQKSIEELEAENDRLREMILSKGKKESQ